MSCVDASRKRRLRNDAPSPNRFDQIVFTNNAVAIGYQVRKEVEGLGFNRQYPAAPAQLLSPDINGEIFETIEHF
jgi:hypothetical protein